ncbi:MAG: PQQ-binding-like beta-propeller repeat protein [Pirellulales bacterium]
MSNESATASRTQSPQSGPRRGPRHVWFPIVVVLAVAAWLAWRRSLANYQTLYHVVAILVGALLISFWFADYGGLRRRIGRTIVAVAWLTVLLVFRPVHNGDMGIVSWRWRFGAADDERLADVKAHDRIDDWQSTPRDYPRFLGNGPWPEVTGVRLETDWQTQPPQLVWRREIGAGWSAFAAVGRYAFTQEQRGEHEMVTCYRVEDGSPVWAHADAARFDPAGSGGLGDVGPRATPTIVGDRVFTQGATGVVNCLNARTGEVVWSHDTVKETGIDLLTWGKSGSPLVVDDMVLISIGAPADTLADGESALAGGPNGTAFHSSLIAYDIETGKVRWSAGTRQASYSSPIATTLAGERQIICVNEHHLSAHRVSDGKVLWEYPWPGEQDTTATASQPVPVGGDRMFVSKGYGVGASLLEISRGGAGQWAAAPLWNPPVRPVMKTKLSNVVVRDGFVYGLDEVLLECIELDSGRVMWKKRRQPAFGHGQLLLVGDVMLVLSEAGELAVVEASPERYHELAHIQALDPDEITWNTPAFAPPFLLIRNAKEAACYRLPLKH